MRNGCVECRFVIKGCGCLCLRILKNIKRVLGWMIAALDEDDNCRDLNDTPDWDIRLGISISSFLPRNGFLLRIFLVAFRSVGLSNN